MDESVFKFKKFNVLHGNGSMKIGVDAVLLGSWVGKKANKILDVGTGCGIISLMLAQRFPEANIFAIDIDAPSIEESQINFRNSPWSSRLKTALIKFPEEIINKKEKFDLIVSNPPYFNSGIDFPLSPREKARHQDSLSIFSLIEKSPLLLENEGCLSLIFPIDYLEVAIERGKKYKLEVKRICKIRDNISRPEKRVMLEFVFCEKILDPPSIESLILFKNGNNNREPTESYRKLCKDFYLKF